MELPREIAATGRSANRLVHSLCLLSVVVGLQLMTACNGDDDPAGTGPGALDDIVSEVDLKPGDETTAVINTHCGYETLQVHINGEIWSTADLPERIPQVPSWPNGYEWARFELSLADARTLLVTVPGSDVSLTYHPDPDPDPCA